MRSNLMFIYLFIHLSICQFLNFIYLFFHSLIHPFIRSITYLFVYLFIYVGEVFEHLSI